MRNPFITITSLWCGGLALALASACSSPAGGPGGSDDDNVGPDAGIDAPPCSGTPHAEEPGNGRDDDCDGLVDETRVCANGGDFTSIAAAVTAAPDHGAIEVCPGSYLERFELAGKHLTIRGGGAATTFLDGGGNGPVIVIHDGAGLVLDQLAVTHGHSTGGGGDIVCDHGGLTMSDSALTDGRAETGGGGLFGNGCDVHITGSTFSGNEGVPMGGAIALVDSTGAIADSHFSANAADDGGAIHLQEGSVTLRNNELRGNTGRVHGGAMWVGADSVVEDNVVAGNHAGWDAGGLWVDRHAPTVQRNTFDGNDAIEEAGGVYLNQSHAHFSDNHVTNNSAMDDGGGMRVFTCNATLERNVISGNHAGLDGGGLKDSHLPSLYVDNTITDNVTMWAGGGIEMDNDASVIRGGLIARNHAAVGGGVHGMLWPWEGGGFEDVKIVDNVAVRGAGVQFHEMFYPVHLTRVTISGNVASGDGGGLWARQADLNVVNSTIVGNHAHVGGGVWVGPLGQNDPPWTDPCPCPPAAPTMHFGFSVVSGNAAPTGAGAFIGIPNVTFENSILEGNSGNSSVSVAQGVAAPTWRYNDVRPATFDGMADPTGQLGNLAAAPDFLDMPNGDFHLRAGSALIDAGDPAMRDRDGTCADMGAFAGPDAP
ncbi:MAG TPA: NosD domain-containing protein [Kofleriaceae bacterium]|nr:NosD domain-containing protein [Kofleriaceae bacterium]